MATNTTRSDGINRRNELLATQNDLLREQTNLLRLLVSSNKVPWGGVKFSADDRAVFVENIDHDEMRDGFLVTSQRKKLWNVQINLINEFARICKKHNLRWFAGYGTLLGAARHRGFIPRDDDVDIIMFRPDYEKFKLVAATEIKAPYFLDIWYNYRLESEGASLNDDEGDFQFITADQRNYQAHISHLPLIKIRDSRTSMIEFLNRNFIDQGIWIDIFPLDPVPPFAEQSQAVNFEVARTLLYAAALPQVIIKAMQEKQPLPLKYDELKKFLALPYRERGRILDNFLKEKFFIHEYVNQFHQLYYFPNSKPCKTADFTDVTYLPFEKIEVPAPINYDSALTDCYGDWRKPVFRQTHVQIYSTEISWREYFRKTIIK